MIKMAEHKQQEQQAQEPEFDELQKLMHPAWPIRRFTAVNKTLTARYPQVLSEGFYGVAVNEAWILAVDAALELLCDYVRYTGENILVRGISTSDAQAPPVFDIAWPMNQPQPVLIKVLECVMVKNRSGLNLE
jgi:hypothetical protein